MAEVFIGNQTARHLTDQLQPFHYGLTNGFSAFEWFADAAPDSAGNPRGWDFDQCLPAQRAFLRDLSSRKIMRFSAHARWDADPRFPDGAAQIRDAMQFAEEIGAPVVVVHLCDKIADILDFVSALCPLAANFPTLKIAVENTALNSPAHFQRLFAELKKFANAEQIGMTFDFGHANCCDATRNDFVRFINELPDDARIFHLHVHENWGDRDAHLPLFTGPAAKDDRGIRAAIKALAHRKFSGSAILEQYPEPPTPLITAYERLNEIFAWRHYSVYSVAGEKKSAEAVEEREQIFADFCAGKISAAQNLMFAATMDSVAAEIETVQLPEVSEANDDLSDAENLDIVASETAKNITRISFAQNDSSNSSNSTDLVDSAGAQKIPLKFPRPEADNEVAAYAEIVGDAMRTHTSWRTRLQWIRDEIGGGQMTVGKLSALAALLRYLATGALVCAEDGGHYRPNHHAQAGAEIESAIEKIGAPAWLRRRIYPYLPSHASAFAVKEPLTRIRDIAHRNDIPQALKQRIKHDLQNKLHRSAGPEDLITAKAILADITSPNVNYSPDFVREFKIFFGELSDFFNVPDLPNRLRAVSEKFPRLATVCAEFSIDRIDPATQVKAAINLRSQIASEMFAASSADRQTLRMADLELENLVFARLSELLNHPPAIGSDDWLTVAQLAVNNAALSEPDTPELAILAEEMSAWKANFQLTNPLHAARMLATFSRLLRVCADYQARMYVSLLPAAEKIGATLSIPTPAIAAFGEGIIRAGVLFQPAKMAETILPTLRSNLQLPAWDIIVPGVAAGKLFSADALAEIPPQNRDVIARVNHADGDEEIPHYIRGVILATSLPQLSHLAIRARQQGVVFASAEDPTMFANLSALDGREITFRADADGVKITDGVMAVKTNSPTNEFFAPAKIERTEKICLLSPAEINRENSGAKAANGARLAELAGRQIIAAAAPTAFAIPFGVMDIFLRGGFSADAYECLLKSLPFGGEAEIVDKLPALKEIILNLPDLPAEFFAPLVSQFPQGTRFAVRSSSNGEDLKNLAGAGLYDSVIGVTTENLATAVKQVWASLWTKRAALSRHYQGISHHEIAMAVLLQEALSPDYSFVIHTADPITGESGKAKIEIAVGLGETLASANQPGRPYQLSASTGSTRLWSCADYTFALRIGETGENRDGAFGEPVKELVNYAKIGLSANERELITTAERLGDLARAVEREFDCPQDIEGAIINQRIYLLQTRPQTGIDEK